MLATDWISDPDRSSSVEKRRFSFSSAEKRGVSSSSDEVSKAEVSSVSSAAAKSRERTASTSAADIHSAQRKGHPGPRPAWTAARTDLQTHLAQNSCPHAMRIGFFTVSRQIAQGSRAGAFKLSSDGKGSADHR